MENISAETYPPNFIQEGSLIDTGAGSWKFTYEKSGSSALTVLLVFNASSECLQSGNKINCSNLKQGERVQIEGYKSEELVNVYTLQTQ